VVGGGWKLGADPAGSADHGLHLQAVGFEANVLEEFDQDIQCCFVYLKRFDKYKKRLHLTTPL
jgi:hypothetical protein